MGKVYFDDDDFGIIEIFIKKQRKEVIDEIKEAIEHIDDGEMKGKCIKLKEKLEKLSDKEFDSLEIIATGFAE